MKHLGTAMAAMAVWTPAGIAGASAATSRTMGFDDDADGAPPKRFTFARTGNGRDGKWVVLKKKEAPSRPNLLAQLDDDDTDDRFAIAVVADAPLLDLKLSVRCKPMAGKVDRACGVVFRYRDAKNYYVARANALEDNIRLYHVKDGQRTQIASWTGKVRARRWHKLGIVAKGGAMQVHWDGKRVIGTRDATFGAAGLWGVWTKADSVTYFDDLRASPIAP
ncbi:MAG: hypothetical protein HYY84_02185 [Deltaproteobacteria bacterium]|nr:hypothetical protein [Deltaproteobacteria bacterium]